jgi:uncharacterized membrane protein YbhN (UPF0104 family)
MTALRTGRTAADRRAAVAAFLLGLVLVVALALVAGVSLRDIGAAVLQMPASAYLSIPAVQAALILLAAWKWHLLLSATSDGPLGLSLRHATSATGLGTLAGQVLPLQLVTPVIRATAARRHGVSASHAVGTSVFEQLFEVIVLVSMALAGLAVSVLGLRYGPPMAAALLVSLTLLIAPALALGERALEIAARLGLCWARPLAEGMRTARALPQRLLVQLMGLSILRYALMLWLNLQILAWLLPDAPLLPLALAFPLVQGLTALPLVTGGLGITEATWAGLLIASGIPAGEAAEAALSLRVISTAGFLCVLPVLLLAGTGPVRGPA